MIFLEIIKSGNDDKDDDVVDNNGFWGVLQSKAFVGKHPLYFLDSETSLQVLRNELTLAV